MIRLGSSPVASPFLLLVTVAALPSCDVLSGPGHSVQVAVSELRLIPGQDSVLSAWLVDPQGGPVPADRSTFSWSSSNPAVAEVAGGHITAVGPGEASVSVRHSGARADVHVQVLDADLQVVEGQAQTGEAMTRLSDYIAVRLADSGGIPVSGVSVTWLVESGGGEAMTGTAITNDQGVVGARWTLGPDPGEQALTAIAGSLTARVTATALPHVASLEPFRIEVGANGLTLIVHGAGFPASATATWNGTALSTVVQSKVRLEALVPASLLTPAGDAEVRVTAAPNETSSGRTFQVRERRSRSDVTESSRLVAAGNGASCGLGADTLTYCWGADDHGQLGNGENGSSRIPTAVVGGLSLSQVVLSAGHYRGFGCGLDSQGAAFCWGDNSLGQIGVGAVTPEPAPSPQRVATELRFVSLDAGQSHACALTADGQVYCWGAFCGAVAGACEASAVFSAGPRAVEWEDAFITVTAGGGRACGITTLGDAVCWNQDRSPHIVGRDAFTMLSAGHDQTCGLASDARALCWGPAALMPQEIAGAPEFVSLSVGANHRCGLTSDGTAYCWGTNTFGQIGDGSTYFAPDPLAVLGGPFVAVAAGKDHTCALATEGVMSCWGRWNEGQLGDGGDPTKVTIPTPVAGGRSFTEVDANCGLSEQGVAWCWGVLPGGAGSYGDRAFSWTPQAYSATDSLVQIATGARRDFGVVAGSERDQGLCGLTQEGSILCTEEQRGGNVLVPFSTSFVATELVSGPLHHCALDTTGTAYCWGDNYYGQLGNGTLDLSEEPVAVRAGALKFVALAAGGSHTCGIADDGSTYCWGLNFWGSLGNGSLDGEYCPVYKGAVPCSTSPVRVETPLVFESLSLGGATSCGFTGADEAHCWGLFPGVYGDVGMAPDYCSGYLSAGDPCALKPVEILPGQAVTDIAFGAGLGDAFACAILDEMTHCWGENERGQLGRGSLGSRDTDEMTPMPVLSDQAFKSVSAYRATVCARTLEDMAYCWGDNQMGATGTGPPELLKRVWGQVFRTP